MSAGDAVLAPKPGYPLIESIARLECVDTIEYQLRFDGSWYIDVAELRALLDGPQGARIRALVLINPNNPTGSYVKAGEREQLVGLCRERGVAIIARGVLRLRTGAVPRQCTARRRGGGADVRVGRVLEDARRAPCQGRLDSGVGA